MSRFLLHFIANPIYIPILRRKCADNEAATNYNKEVKGGCFQSICNISRQYS
jgi:hypothetical protein